jgi:hypothetical protein
LADARWLLGGISQNAPYLVSAVRRGMESRWRYDLRAPPVVEGGLLGTPILSLDLGDERRDPRRAHAIDIQERVELRDDDLTRLEGIWRQEDGSYGPPSYLDRMGRQSSTRSGGRPVIGRFGQGEQRRRRMDASIQREVDRIERATAGARNEGAAAAFQLMAQQGSGSLTENL